jgi:pimeloyl-ACP methyl ester carboxylesterase
MAWAELSDSRCYYEVLGQGDPLLLVPGLGVTCRTWDAVVPDLSRHFTLILTDNRGLGMSQAKRPPTSLADYSADLVELLDYLQVDRTHVLGLSLGGIISQRFAIEHAKRVDRLVLVSCAHRFSPFLRQMAHLLRHALRRFPWEVFLRSMDLLGTSPEFIDANEELLEQQLRVKCNVKLDRNAVIGQLRCLACHEIAPEDYRIHAPTLVIAGQHDRIIPSCYAQKMSECIPGAKFIELARCGHNPFEEMPEIVVPRIIEFLRDRSVGGSTTIVPAGHVDCSPASPVELCV